MSNFGYSDNDFEDFSWFSNCMDNCGSSSDGGDSNGNKRWAIIIICAVILIGLFVAC